MKKPIQFGKYYLLERINVGGMAEVFRAKAYGVEGFERLVAVKRILPNIAEDKEFIRMFVDEAKIAVQLNHANIAQIFDLGVEEGAYYIALEHIHGRDLRVIFDRGRNRGEPMPVAQACFVTMKVCEGLDYAHNKRDQGGPELGLVHRDVSPQNILVSFEGEVKIIDFGIAKAAGKGSKTQAGILKGKFGYMSPEQVRGLPIDRRSDVFSCGIVLYELLTGERLFIGESDFSTLEKVRNVEILPPSTYNRKIPPELERIVLKALSKDVEDRYQNAIDLHDELQAFVYTAGEFYSRKDLAGWMKQTFAREIEEETAKLEAYRRMAPPPEHARNTLDGPPGSVAGQTVDLSGAARRASTAPPPVPGQRRTQAVGTVPPPVPAPAAGGPGAQAQVQQAQVQQARGAGLEWDDDELETSIYDEIKPASNTPAPSGGLASQEEREPDLSTLVNTARGWDAPDTVLDEQPASETPERVADGSNRTKSPIGEPGEPSAVARLASMAAAQHGAAPLHDPHSYGETYVPPDRKSRAGVYLGVAAAALVVAGGVLAVFFIANGDSGAEAVAAESAAEAGTAEAQVAGGAGAAQGAEGAAGQAVADPDTGFDLIVDPAGVNVKLDGRVIGKAPLQIRNLTEGEHFVEIEAPPGFFNKTQTVQVSRNAAERVVIKLDAMDIVGTFVSTPTGAEVTLVSGGERQRLGRAPVEAKLDPRKRYEVVFEKDGFVTVTRPLELTGVPELDVEVELSRARVATSDRPERRAPRERTPNPVEATPPPVEPADEPAASEPVAKSKPQPAVAQTGILMLGSKPPCSIFIDGRDTGMKTPQRDIELEVGRHRITLINNELGIKESFSVKIKPGETTKAIKDLTAQL